MEYVVIGILGLLCGSLFVKVIDNKKILELEEENYELQKWKNNNIEETQEIKKNAENAECRALTFARKFKKLENIAIEGEQNNDCAAVTLAKIKKELLITR